MSRFIMLTLIGALLTFVVLDLIAVFGLNAVSKVMERDISIKHINRDITFIESFLCRSDTAVVSCKNSCAKVPGLKKFRLPEKCTDKDIQTSRLEVLETSRLAAHCYQEIAKICVLNNDERCTRESLFALAEYIDMTGRHMDENFNKSEKELYRKVLLAHDGQSTGEEVMQLADAALPVFDNIIQRLDTRFFDWQKIIKKNV